MEQKARIYHLARLIAGLVVIYVLRACILNVPYARQGFFCHDDEIRFPLYIDTVSSDFMQYSFFVMGVLMTVTVEYTLIKHLTKKNQRLCHNDSFIHPGVFNVIYFIISYICCSLAVGTVANLGKRTISRLRPNFLAVCKPNLTELCPPETYRYVEEYVCYGNINEDEYFSFPSGHAAHSVAYAVFCIYYLQKRCKFPEPTRSLLQFVIVLYSFFICLSRVRDHKHRLSDVSGGAMLGATTTFFFTQYVLRVFRHNRYQTEKIPDDLFFKGKKIMPTIVIHEKGYLKLKDEINRIENCSILANSSSDYGSITDS